MIPRGISQSRRLLILSHVVTATTILISLMQGIFFALKKPWISYNLFAMCFAAATLLLAWKYLVTNKVRFLGLALLLLSAQLIIFMVTLAGTEPPFSHRLLQIAIIVSYFSTIMIILLACIRRLDPINAILLSFSVAMGIFLGELALGLLYATNTNSLELWPRWTGPVSAHNRLGYIYPPYSVLKTYYPDNPRGYFEEEDSGQSKWRLEVQKGNAADLVFSSDKPEWLRISIKNAETEIPWDIQFNQGRLWHIQLNQDHLAVKSNHRYTVNFRARADNPRSIIVGFARAHDYWSNLGLYKDIELITDWQKFELEFEAVADDDNARIHFDLGGSGIPVEFSDVMLRSLSDGNEPNEPIVPKKYFVNYKSNALGCRGRDYTIPKPKDTTRILAIGDSFTMGVGVHEGDTFASQLEHLLNEKAESLGSGRVYEVINCGVSGYGTRQERLFYELLASRYEPKIILLVMVWNDNLSFLDEVRLGYLNRSPGKFERLFYIWNKIQEYRHRRPLPDYSACINEILRLQGKVQKKGARLAIMIFRNNSDYGNNYYSKAWDLLTKTVTEKLRGTDIPILNLGKVLHEKYPNEDLTVHKVDGHPNQVAHRAAAREVLSFLQRKGMLRFQ